MGKLAAPTAPRPPIRYMGLYAYHLPEVGSKNNRRKAHHFELHFADSINHLPAHMASQFKDGKSMSRINTLQVIDQMGLRPENKPGDANAKTALVWNGRYVVKAGKASHDKSEFIWPHNGSNFTQGVLNDLIGRYFKELPGGKVSKVRHAGQP